jgi:hypothetical protein
LAEVFASQLIDVVVLIRCHRIGWEVQLAAGCPAIPTSKARVGAR